LILKLIDGEEVEIVKTSESFIQRVHNALATSLARNRFSPVAATPTAINQEPSVRVSAEQPS